MHQITLRKGKEEPLQRKHPWVFSGAIDKKPDTLQDGDPVQVVGADKEVLGIGFYSPSSISVKIIGFGKEAGKRSVTELLAGHISNAIALRSTLGLLQDPDTNAFRLVNAEGDNLPGLIVDLYNDTAVIQAHSEGMHKVRHEIAKNISSHNDLTIRNIVCTREGHRSNGDENPPLEPLLGEMPTLVMMRENGLQFYVDVARGQKTGFFLDQRNNRALIGSLCKDRKVLNVCSYTGGFSIYALSHGASEVTSLDLSKEALTLAEKNVALNGFSSNHKIIARDCFEYLTNCPDHYDCIILDPPAFAKHRNATKNALNGYRSLNRLAIEKLAPRGILATFSCSQLISRDEFEQAAMSAAIESGKDVKVLYKLSQAPCHPTSIFHPEGPYLKGLVLEVQ